MQNRPTPRLLFSRVATILTTVVLGSSPAWAQTPPTAETTFTNVSGNLWGTGANWSGGVPTLVDPGDDALIGASQTVVYNQTTNGNGAFGTLTLGAGAIMQNTITSNQLFMVSKTVYLNNNSVFEITSGSLNSSPNFQIVPSATATLRGSMTMVQGSVNGAGNLNVTLSSSPEWRAASSSMAGNLTFSSSTTAARQINLTKFTAANTLGTGTATFSDNTAFNTGTANANKLSASSTLKVIGDSGSTTVGKLLMASAVTQTVGNLIVESPGSALTGAKALMKTGTATTAGTLSVATTTTFQGTADTVEIDNLMTTPTGNSLITKNLTFAGSGNWAVTGDGKINLSGGLGGSTITTNVNASIANALTGTSGFIKAGTGTLSLTGNLSGLTGDIDVTDGELLVSGTISGMSVSTDAELTIGSLSSATDVLSLGSAGLTLESGSAINWQFNGSTPGTYDSIVSTGTLDLTGLSNIIINGTSLGYQADMGDVFTLFDGTVTGFDPSKFVLNMPAPLNGEWAIEEGSLQLVVVPEPSGILISGVGLLGLLLRRRR